MKTILTLLIVVALGVTGQASTNAMLRGIRIVETQDQLHPPRGKLGERGPYQFRPSTWRMHTASSFDLAENREVANTVAKRHYAWIQAQLTAAGIEPSPYNVAMAWNAGVNAVIRGRVPAVSRDYAARVLNIASTFAPEQPKPAQAPGAEITSPDDKPENPPLNAIALAFVLAVGTGADQPSPVVAAVQEPAPAPVVDLTPAEVPASETPAEAPATTLVAQTAPATEGSVEVRFHTNPVMRAFSQTSQQETPAKESTSKPVEIASILPVGIDASAVFGRM